VHRELERLRKMSSAAWELPSSSGVERVRWTVTDTRQGSDDVALVVNAALQGGFLGLTKAPKRGSESPDFILEIRGLSISRRDLQSLAGVLTEWLARPVAEVAKTPLDLSYQLGGLFDQNLFLSVRQAKDLSLAGRAIASVMFAVGQLKGEFSFVVDTSCLQVFADGLQAALREAS